MKSNMKRVAALVLAVMMTLSMLPGAMAAEYFSGSLTVGGRVKRATPAPTEVIVETTPAPAEDAPVEEAPEATEVPIAEETEAAAAPEATAAPEAPEVPEETADPAPQARQGMIYKAGEDKVANIRALPDAESTRLGKAHHGDMITVYEEDGNWMYGEVIGITGWVHGSMITFDETLFEVVEETEAEEAVTEEPVVEETVETEEVVTEEPVVEETVETEEPTEVSEIVEAPVVEEKVTEKAAEEVEEIVVVDVRLDADGLSEIILTVPAETAATVLAVDGDWVQVEVEGVTGYIFIDDTELMANLTGMPEAEPVPTPAPGEVVDPTANMKVTIFTSRRSVVTPGETIYLTSKIEGFDNFEIMYVWECDKGNGFEAVEGAHADTYSFAASIETLSYDWRLTVYYR